MMEKLLSNLPEELPEHINSPRSARAWVYNQLCREGYRILLEPNPEDLPKELSDFSMDLLAFKKEESIAVIIRRVNDISDNSIALMDAVRVLPGWTSLFIAIPVKASQVSANRDVGKVSVEAAA
jgi:hypothetical protein